MPARASAFIRILELNSILAYGSLFLIVYCRLGRITGGQIFSLPALSKRLHASANRLAGQTTRNGLPGPFGTKPTRASAFNRY